MEAIKSVIEKLRLKELFGALLIAGLFVTFMPDKVALTMQISQFKAKYQPWISAEVIVVGSFYVYWIAEHFCRKVRRKLSSEIRFGTKYMKKYITEEEKELLVEAFYDEQNQRFKSSGYIDISDGRIAALQSRNIIYRSSSVSAGYTTFAYNLQPYALELLNKNVEKRNIVIGDDEYRFSVL